MIKLAMITFNSNHLDQLAKALVSGEVCVLPSDTLYGLHAITSNKSAVEKIYSIKQREHDKPFIILIPSINSLTDFGVNLTNWQNDFVLKNWPNKLSIVCDVEDPKLEYLHRGTKSLAFRLPNFTLLQKLLSKTGPLVSTTVNISGEPYSKDIMEAKKVCGDKISIYADHGVLDSAPSTVVKFNGDSIVIIRQGSYKINE